MSITFGIDLGNKEAPVEDVVILGEEE